MQDSRRWATALFLCLVALGAPALADADFACPGCEPEDAGLDYRQVVNLVVTTVLEKGVSILFVGATAAVGVPWIVAGVAIGVFYLPRLLKASW